MSTVHRIYLFYCVQPQPLPRLARIIQDKLGQHNIVVDALAALVSRSSAVDINCVK